MNRLTLLLLPLLMSLVALTGCPVTNPDPHPICTMPGGGAAENASERQVVILQIKLTSIEVPVGTASESEEIWNYLDEERAQAGHAATLGRNGMRVGLAKGSTWKDLARILQKMTGQTLAEQNFAALPGQPFQVELKTFLDPQTIFTSYADRTLSGADYPSGDNLLVLSVTLDETNTSRMIVTAMPQIRSTHRVQDIVTDNTGRLTFVDHPVLYSFRPATFQTSMSDDEILVIGPGAESRRPTSIGYHFLLHEKQQLQFETVLVVSIRAVKASVKTPAVSVER